MKFKFLIAAILGLAGYIRSDESCPVYKCVDKLDTCMNPETDAKMIIDLKTCADNYFCDYDNTLIGKCKVIDYSQKQYIGGSCSTKTDCIDNASDCKDGKCFSDKPNLTSDLDCPIGSYFNSPACVTQLAVGATCKDDKNCVNNAACYSNNSTCISYFSLADDEIVKDTESSLCTSGFALDGKCSSASLKTDGYCTQTCTYILPNKTEYNSTNACVCGKNSDGKKNCKFGVNNQEFINTLNLKKSNLNNKDCHTRERLMPCASSSFDKNNTTHNAFDYKKSVKNYHNSIIRNHLNFKNVTNDSCILPVVGAYDSNLITPVSFNACPKYDCNKGGNSCFNSYNPNNFDSSEIKVTLSTGVCLSNQTCVPGDYSKIYQKERTSSTCQFKTKNMNKYPGEKCLVNEDCVNKNCTSGVCQYLKNDEACNISDFNKFCGLDSYCFFNTTDNSSLCKSQLAKGNACSSTFGCPNNYACYNKTCQLEYGTLDENFEFDVTLFPKDFNEKYETLCKSLNFNKNKKRCTRVLYSSELKVDSNGYVACSLTGNKDECKYNSTGDIIAQPCACGFNKDGQGYCPIDQGKHESKYNDLLTKFKKYISARCNTYNRYQCDEDDGLTNFNKNFIDLATSHLFYNSVDCAKEVLSSSFTQLSLLFFAIMALLI